MDKPDTLVLQGGQQDSTAVSMNVHVLQSACGPAVVAMAPLPALSSKKEQEHDEWLMS